MCYSIFSNVGAIIVRTRSNRWMYPTTSGHRDGVVPLLFSVSSFVSSGLGNHIRHERAQVAQLCVSELDEDCRHTMS